MSSQINSFFICIWRGAKFLVGEKKKLFLKRCIIIFLNNQFLVFCIKITEKKASQDIISFILCFGKTRTPSEKSKKKKIQEIKGKKFEEPKKESSRDLAFALFPRFSHVTPLHFFHKKREEMRRGERRWCLGNNLTRYPIFYTFLPFALLFPFILPLFSFSAPHPPFLLLAFFLSFYFVFAILISRVVARKITTTKKSFPRYKFLKLHL